MEVSIKFLFFFFINSPLLQMTISPPPSPTLSTVWKHKSPSELIPLLKAAYAALKDKEKSKQRQIG